MSESRKLTCPVPWSKDTGWADIEQPAVPVNASQEAVEEQHLQVNMNVSWATQSPLCTPGPMVYTNVIIPQDLFAKHVSCLSNH